MSILTSCSSLDNRITTTVFTHGPWPGAANYSNRIFIVPFHDVSIDAYDTSFRILNRVNVVKFVKLVVS